MSEKQQICPVCFHLIPAALQVCPHCDANLAVFSARDFQEKLLHALLHPLADVRMRAIIALGWRGEPDTAEELTACALRHPTDVVQGLEIVNSLAKLQAGKTMYAALAELKKHHPAHAVREDAARALDTLKSGKR